MNTTYIEPEGFQGTKGRFVYNEEESRIMTDLELTIIDLSKISHWCPDIELQANAALLVNAKEMLKELQMLVGRLEALKEDGHLRDSFKLTSSYQVINNSLGLYTETTKH